MLTPTKFEQAVITDIVGGYICLMVAAQIPADESSLPVGQLNNKVARLLSAIRQAIGVLGEVSGDALADVYIEELRNCQQELVSVLRDLSGGDSRGRCQRCYRRRLRLQCTQRVRIVERRLETLDELIRETFDVNDEAE